MRKAKVTYNAPAGDNKVVEMGGVTFFDGKEVEINSTDHKHLMSKLVGNQHFDIEIGDEVADDKPKRGRPPGKRDLKAGIDEARDHDFEKDRRDKLAPADKLPDPKPAAAPAPHTFMPPPEA